MAGKHPGSTNYRDDVAAVQELKWRAADREDSNISKLLSGDKKQSTLTIDFEDAVSSADVTPYSIAVIKSLMLLSGVQSLSIGSAYRSPEEQARVMFENLESGKRIGYKQEGAAVTAKYDDAKKVGKRPDDTLRLMVNEIYRLGPEEVSKHASPPDWLNVVDISPSSIPAGHRAKFIKAVNRFLGTYISRFLHPGNSKDPAFHIEIPQGKTLVIKEVRQST